MTGLQLLTRFGVGGASGGGPPPTPQYGITTFVAPNSLAAAGHYGWAFTVGASNITVTALRVNMNAAVANETLSLWNSAGTLLGQVTVSTPSADVWAEGSITPVVLTSGQNYSVTNWRAAGSRNTNRNQATSSTMGFNSALTFLNALSGSGSGRPTGNIGDFLNGIVDIVFTI